MHAAAPRTVGALDTKIPARFSATTAHTRAAPTYVERGVLPPHVVVDVGDPQGLHRGSTDAQEDLGPNEQQVHHVGGRSVAADEVRVWPLVATGAVGGTDVAALRAPADLARLVLVLVREELGQRGQQRAQRHHDASAADEPRPVPARPEVAHKEDERQVPDLEAAGDHAHVRALQVEPALQGGQDADLGKAKGDINQCAGCLGRVPPFWGARPPRPHGLRPNRKSAGSLTLKHVYLLR